MFSKDTPASGHLLPMYHNMQQRQHHGVNDISQEAPYGVSGTIATSDSTIAATQATQQLAPFSNSNCILKSRGTAGPSLLNDCSLSEYSRPMIKAPSPAYVEQQCGRPPTTSLDAIDFDGQEDMVMFEEDHEDRKTPESQGSIEEPFIPPPSPKYELRAGVRSSINLTTWVDKDDSGNYDPSPKTTRLAAKKRSSSTGGVGRDKRVREEGPREFKRMTLLSARQNGARLPVTLKVDTEEGKERLRAFASTHTQEEFATYEEKYYSTIPHLDLNDPQSESEAWEIRRTRAHSRYNNIVINETADRTFIPDPLVDGEEVWTQDNLFGHPAARGCVGCRKLNTPCSLLAPDAPYPCVECQYVDEECLVRNDA